MELKNLKGTMDYLPEEQAIRQGIINKLQGVFEKYGYQPLETPMICHYDLLASKYAGGAEILKEVYKLTDQGERELGLRYDLTVPFAKVIGMNPEMKMPFKRYEIGRVFRDGPVKTGRNREFIQCDVDVVGIKSVMAEAEFMMMTVDAFKALEMEVYISYNNRKLLTGMIESVGIDGDMVSRVILCLDKLEKIGEQGVLKDLMENGIEMEKGTKLLSFMRMASETIIQQFSKDKGGNIEAGISELNQLNQYIRALEIEPFVKFTPSLARGLEIYTGTVWEVFLTDGSITSSIGSGGRYDNIIGAFIESDVPYPAVGMSFGLDVIFTAMKLRGSAERKAPVDLYLIPIGTETECLKLATKMRREGIKTDVEMTGRKLKKALDYANKVKIPYVIIIGESELESGTVEIKNMLSGTVERTALKEKVNEMMTGQ